MHLAKSEGHEENTKYHKQGGELIGAGRTGMAQTLWIVTLGISGTVTKRMASGLHTTVSLYSRADSAFPGLKTGGKKVRVSNLTNYVS